MIRAAQSSDIPALARLSRLAFAPTQTNQAIADAAYAQGVDLPDRAIFLAMDSTSHRPVGKYTQRSLQVFFQGASLPALGLAGVAVAPEVRGQGVARQLIHHALASAQAQSLPLSILYPFRHAFYRRFGWVWTATTYQYRVAPSQIPRFPDRSHLVAYDATQHDLKAIYAQAAPQHNGWLQRPDWLWEQYLQAQTDIFVSQHQDGYVILQFQYLDAQQQHLAANVREWVALTPPAYRGILGFLASLRDQVDTILWHTDAQDPFPHLLTEQQRNPQLSQPDFDFELTHSLAELGSGYAWRLVDLERAIATRPIQPGPAFHLTFQVRDPVLGDRTLHCEGWGQKMYCVAQPAATTIHLGIDHLTQLVSGMRRAVQLEWLGELEVEGDRRLLQHLDTAWATDPLFCWDFF